MPNGGTLTIATTSVAFDRDVVELHMRLKPRRYLVLTVTDTGSGVSEEVKSRAFEPFFTTKQRGQGTGLGLSVSHDIVAQNGGGISVESTPGQGATFSVFLPRTEDGLSSPDLDDPEAIPAGDETVLLVEDEPIVREAASQALRSRGFVVLEASDGLEAARVAEEHAGERIHVALIDLVLPLMTGTEVARIVKEIHPEAEVLYTSAVPVRGAE